MAIPAGFDRIKPILKKHFYRGVFVFVLSWLLLFILLLFSQLSFSAILSSVKTIFLQLIFSWQYWSYYLLLYLLVALVLFLVNTYRKHGIRKFAKRSLIIVVLPLMVLFSSFKISQHYVNLEDYNYLWDSSIENKTGSVLNKFAKDGKQRGVHFFGAVNKQSLNPLITNNVEWITIVPFMGQNEFDGAFGFSENTKGAFPQDAGLAKKISNAQQHGFKVLLKPHIWLRNSGDKWRSDIFPKDEKTWQDWSKNYRSQILHYARIAQNKGVEILCVGTELSRLTKERPEFWRNLIDDVRQVYDGKLTYGANWNDEYDKIEFWDQLDFIGIQAYFPLVSQESKILSELERGWNSHLAAIQAIQQRFSKPVLFTELGYKSTEDAARNPWRWVSFSDRIFTKVSYETQALSYQAFFNTIWQQDWFAGVHIWEWQSRFSKGLFEKDHNFTPQGKPAQNIIAKGFK